MPEIDLNPQQQGAVAAALVEPLWWVWGPPGTGKTRTLGALVAEATARGERLLVAAHSNIAVDTAMVATADELEARRSEPALVDETVVRAGPAIVAEARDALFDVLHGRGRRPLTCCPMHGVPTIVSVQGSSVLVACPRPGCTTRRRAGAADLDLWAIYVDHRCDACGAVLTAASGAHGWFYRCPQLCRFTEPIS